MDGRNEDGSPIIYYKKLEFEDRRGFMLSHSCDEWVIGDIEETKKFIKLLTELVHQAELEPDKYFDTYKEVNTEI